MNRLILSLFPGVGLLDAQFEAEGFCVVRGPDLIFGGDVRQFFPPSGVFDGVIGGPPCQDFSAARRTPPTGEGVELLGEFCRVVQESQSRWFLCENVPAVPDITVEDYHIQRIDIDQAWYSGIRRLRHIQFGRHGSGSGPSRPLDIPRGEVSPGAEPPALANDDRPFTELCRLQGLPSDFELPSFHDRGRKRAVGNGVPALMGRKLAAAVRLAMFDENGSDEPEPTFESGRRLCSECQRPLTGRAVTCSSRCRKTRSRKRKVARQP